MKSKQNNSLLAFALFVVWIGLMALYYHDFMRYKYLQIGDMQSFFRLLFWLVILPVIFLGLTIIDVAKAKNGWVPGTISLLLCVAFVPAVFLASVGSGLYQIPFLSLTDDADNFGDYDHWVQSAIKFRPEAGFPQEKLVGAEDIRFFYWFFEGASHHYCVMVSWEIRDEVAFQDEIDRLEKCGYSIEEDQSVYILDPEYTGYSDSEIMIDWENRRFIYFIFNSSDIDTVPKSLDEYYSRDFSKKGLFEVMQSVE